MKKLVRFLFLLLLLFVVSACGEKEIAVESVTISESAIELNIGEEKQLSAVVKPDDATEKEVKWSSEDPSVATVSETGLVKGVKTGKTKVFAEAGGVKGFCEVTVIKSEVVLNLLSEAEATVDADGGTYQLDYTVSGADVEVVLTCDKESGFAYDEESKVITFSEVDEYNFTLTATDKHGESVSVQFKVIAVNSPLLTLQSEDEELSLHEDPTYKLLYSVNVSDAEISLTCETDGFTFAEINPGEIEIRFKKSGIFEFTLTAQNAIGSDSKTFTVTVTDSYSVKETEGAHLVYDQDFAGTDKPADLFDVITGTGSMDFGQEGTVRFKTEDSSVGEAFLQNIFEEKLSGIIVYEVKFNLNSTNGFINLMYFLSTDGETNAQSFSVQNGGKLSYYANGWKEFLVGGEKLQLITGEWYTFRAVNDFKNNVSYVYVSGDKYMRGNTPAELGENIYLGAIAFRTPDSAVNLFRTGASQRNSDVVFDYFKLSQLLPVITVNTASHVIPEFEDEATYALDFVLSTNTESYEITGEPADGFTLDGKTVTFNQAGDYVFTITATNKFGSQSKTISVSVVEVAYEEPELVVLEGGEDAEYALHDFPTHTIVYQVTGIPEPTVSLVCDRGEWTYDQDGNTIIISFFSFGDFNFELIAENEQGRDIVNITVTVEDTYSDGNTQNAAYIHTENFDGSGDPQDLTKTITGSGVLDASQEGVAIFRTGATSSGEAFYFRNFSEKLGGIVVYEVRFYLNSTNGFINLMYFLDRIGGTTAQSFAIQNNGKLSYHSNGWKEFSLDGASLQLLTGEWYVFRAVNDLRNNVSHVYISGNNYLRGGVATALGNDIYLGVIGFRNAGTDIKVFQIGASQRSSDIMVDYFSLKQLMPSLKVNTPSHTINTFEGSVDYELDFEHSENVEELLIVGEPSEGWSLDGKTVTFTEKGEYVFTITAKNAFGEAQGQITVCVDDREEVTLRINYVNPNGRIVAPAYVGKYFTGDTFYVESPEVLGHVPELAVVSDQIYEDTVINVIYDFDGVETTIFAPDGTPIESGTTIEAFNEPGSDWDHTGNRYKNYVHGADNTKEITGDFVISVYLNTKFVQNEYSGAPAIGRSVRMYIRDSANSANYVLFTFVANQRETKGEFANHINHSQPGVELPLEYSTPEALALMRDCDVYLTIVRTGNIFQWRAVIVGGSESELEGEVYVNYCTSVLSDFSLPSVQIAFTNRAYAEYTVYDVKVKN